MTRMLVLALVVVLVFLCLQSALDVLTAMPLDPGVVGWLAVMVLIVGAALLLTRE